MFYSDTQVSYYSYKTFSHTYIFLQAFSQMDNFFFWRYKATLQTNMKNTIATHLIL